MVVDGFVLLWLFEATTPFASGLSLGCCLPSMAKIAVVEIIVRGILFLSLISCDRRVSVGSCDAVEEKYNP